MGYRSQIREVSPARGARKGGPKEEVEYEQDYDSRQSVVEVKKKGGGHEQGGRG